MAERNFQQPFSHGGHGGKTKNRDLVLAVPPRALGCWVF
jgi:hypothetical protein